jgi:hypothetical protein
VKLPSFRQKDPYWDFFINHPPSRPENQVNNAIRAWPEGSIFPVKKDVHSPDIMSSHIKELARFLGAELTGIVRLSPGSEYPFGIVCAFRAEDDPRTALGHGGQAPVQNGLFVTFNVGAVIREMGYQATTDVPADGEKLAVAAGLGRLDGEGRLLTALLGRKVYVADVLHTDLPLAPDGEASA